MSCTLFERDQFSQKVIDKEREPLDYRLWDDRVSSSSKCLNAPLESIVWLGTRHVDHQTEDTLMNTKGSAETYRCTLGDEANSRA